MYKKTKVISIDHGNRNIKTTKHVFPASYVESGYLPSFGADTLMYNETEYTLVDRRMPQKTDKTVDDTYFILTLFAIGKELSGNMDMPLSEYTEIELLVGLPPLHCKKMGAKFSNYFDNKMVRFEFNKIPFFVGIKAVYVFPQAYAAAFTIHERVKDSRTVNIVDIGGYTVDCLQLVDFQPNMDICTSLYNGVNTLFKRVNESIRAEGGKDIPDMSIEGILLNDERTIKDSPHERVGFVKSVAKQHALDVLMEVSDKGINLTENATVFIGGGSLLLREDIEKSGMVKNPLFVENVNANADGYQLLYKLRKAKSELSA